MLYLIMRIKLEVMGSNIMSQVIWESVPKTNFIGRNGKIHPKPILKKEYPTLL